MRVLADVITSDFVFEDDYVLMSIEELEDFVTKEKHLPEIPSSEEFSNNGYNLGEMDDLLLRKIEQQALYIIELNAKIKDLEEIVKTITD